MLGRFKRDRVHSKWSTAVCVRPRSTEDAPFGCSRYEWTALVASVASREHFSRCRVYHLREREDRRQLSAEHQSNVHCHLNDDCLVRVADPLARCLS